MACGCKNKITAKSVKALPAALRQANARTQSIPAAGPRSLPMPSVQPTTAMDMERRRIERLRREAIKRTFNR